MSNYEDRIIGLKFDNAQFEKRAQKTLNTLDSMTQKIYTLGTRSVTSSFNSISNAAAKVTLNPLNNAVNNVILSFKNLETRAITSLETMAMTALNAGKQFAESLSVDQFAAGWTKYEEKTAAIQTIVAAGYEIEDVNAAMEKLMWYADETSYNFTDMANNIGKFTSMGIDLDTATKSMMGISNWAAVSGQNAASASRAMYNLSQAIGMGKVTLRDWYSIENANMATKEFKETVLETAVELGQLKKAEDGTIKSNDGTVISFENFRDTLDKGYFTTEVLTATLAKYNEYTEEVYALLQDETLGLETAAEAMEYLDNKAKAAGLSVEGLGEKSFKAAQEAKSLTDALNATKDAVSSIWMRMIENITGGYYETKKLWTDFTAFLWDVFAGPLDEIDSYLSKWMGTSWIDENGQELTEREHLLQILYGTMSGIVDLLKVVKQSFLEVFPAKTVKELGDIVERYRQLAKGLVFTTDELGNLTGKGKKLKGVLLGIFSIFKNIINFGKKFKSIFEPLFKSLKGLFTDIADFFLLFNRALPLAKKTPKWLENLTSKIQNGVKIVSDLAESVRSYLVPALNLITNHGVFGVIAVLTKGFGGLSDTIFDLISNFTGLDASIYKSKAKDVIYAIGNRLLVIAQIVKAIIKPVLVAGLTIAATLISRIVSLVKIVIGLIANTWEPLGKIFISLLEAGKKILDAVFDVAPSLFESLGKFLTAAQPIISKIISVLGTGLSLLIRVLPKVIDFLTTIITWVLTKGTAFVSWFKTAGIDTIKGFFIGIKEGFKNSKLFQVFQSIIDGVKKIFGIHSPSTVFFEIGKNIILGLFNGIKSVIGPFYKNLIKLVSKTASLFETVIGAIIDLIKEIKGPLIKIINTLANAFIKIINKIENAIGFDKIFDVVSNIVNKLTSLFSLFLDVVKMLVKEILDSGIIKSIVLMFKSIIDGLSSVNIVGVTVDIVKEFVGMIKVLVNSIASLINGDYLSKLADFLERTRSTELIALATAITIVIKALSGLAVALGVMNVLWNIGSIANGVKNVLKKFGQGILDEITEVLNGLGILMGVILGMMVFAKNMDKDKLISLFAGLTAVVLSIAILIRVASENEITDSQMKSLKSLAVIMSILAGVLSVVALSITPLAKNNWSSILAMAVTIGIVLTALVSSMSSILTIAKGMRLTDSLKSKLLLLTGIFAIMGAIVSGVSLSIASITKSEASSIISAAIGASAVLTSLTGSLAIMVALAKWIKSSGSTTKNLYSLVGVMAIMGAVISEVAAVTTLMVGTSWTSLLQLGAIFAGLLVGATGMLAVSKIFKEVNMASLGASMLAMLSIVGTMAAITAILPKLMDDKLWNALFKAGVILAGTVVALAALGIVGQLVGPGLGLVAVSLITIAAAFFVFAAGASILATAIGVFADSMEKLSNSASTLSESIVSSMTALGKGLASGISEFFNTIFETGEVLYDFFYLLKDIIVASLTSVWDGIVEFMLNIVNKKEDLETIFEGLKEILGSFIDNALELVNEKGPAIIDTIVSLISTAIDKIKEYDIIGKAGGLLKQLLQTITDNSPDIITALETIASSSLTSLKNLSPQLADTINTLITDALTDLMSEQKLGKIVTSVLEFVEKTLDKLIEKAPDLVGKLMTLIIAILDESSKWIFQVTDSVTKLAVNIIGAITVSSISITNAVMDAIVNIISGLANSIYEKGPKIVNALEKLVVAITYVFGYLVGKSLSAAGKGMIAFIQGFLAGVTDLGKSIKDVFKSIGDAFESVFDENSPSKEAWDIGAYLSEGLANGIKSGQSKVESASANVATSALDKMNKKLEIHSPSKKGIEMGEYLDEGLVIGIENGSSDVASAAENTAQSAIDGMTDTVEKSEETVASSFANILSKVKDSLKNGGSVSDLLGGSNSGDVTTFLANLLGINPDDLSLDVRVNLVDGETDLDGLTGDSSKKTDNPSSGPSSSTPRVSSVLAASTSNAINRNIEAYAAQKDADTATIQKILQGLTSTKPANENTFYITNEDPEAVAYAVANTLQRQSESEELVWA